MSSTKTERQSNFELLRIISMLMIIGHHITLHGGFSQTGKLFTVNSVLIQFLVIGGKIGVNLFVLISGYFLVTSKEFKASKAVKLWLQLLFYSCLIFIAGLIFGGSVKGVPIELSFTSIKETVMPVINGAWWFASAYFALFLLSPFINKMLLALSRVDYLKMLILMFVMWSLLYTLRVKHYQMNDLLWFIFIYSLAGYIRLYGKKLFKKTSSYAFLAVGSYLLLTVLRVLFIYFGSDSDFCNKYKTLFMAYNSVPILIVSVSIFLLFKNLTVKRSNLINTLASCAFAVYLIHDSNYIREVLVNYVFRRIPSNGELFIPYALSVMIAIYLTCSVIELIRINLLEKNYMKPIAALTEKLSAFYTKLIEKATSEPKE